MASNQQILSDLVVIMEAGQNLELMNTYKGVPFTCKAQVTAIDGDHVTLLANDPLLVSLANEKEAKLLGSDYFEPAQAQIVAVDIPKGQIILNNFAFLGARLGERMIVRVEPEGSLPIHITSTTGCCTGEVADLSLNGVGVLLGNSQLDAALRPGINVEVTIVLPGGEVLAKGMILSAARLDDIHRMSIRFAPDYNYKLAIFRYLIERRGEIETELRQAYQKYL
jgi:hypothetical protein